MQVLEETGVKLRCSGPPLVAKPEDSSNFWDYLTRQGGNWTWEGLVDSHRYGDLIWLVEGLKRAPLNGARMVRITKAEHLMSVVQGRYIVTLLHWNLEK